MATLHSLIHDARNFPSFSFFQRDQVADGLMPEVVGPAFKGRQTSAPREDHRTKVSPSKATFGDLTCGAPRISCSEALCDSV